MFNRVVNGFDVFEVGKEQLWSWCGWGFSGRQFGCCSMPVECNSDSLALGKYLVVELDFCIQDTEIEGCIQDAISHFSKPKIWGAERSLKAAIEYACALVITPGYRHIGNVVEIWHVVKDDELWSSWIYDSALSLEISDDDFDELADDAYPFGDCWDSCIDACTPSDVCCCETSGCASKVVKVSENPTRYYYAAIHKYGVEFTNDVTALVRFLSRRERDKYVYAEHWEGRKRESVTRDVARGYAPRAFADTGSVVVVDCETGADEMIYYYATRLHAQGYDAWVRLPDGSQCFVCL